MKWLSRFLGGLLVMALVMSAAAWTLEQTLWSESYLEQKTTETNLAEQLAAGLPAVIAAGTSTPGDTQVILSEAITPAFARNQLETVLPQLERYYREGGAPAELDMSDLIVRARAAGFELPADLAAKLETPQPVSAGSLDGTLRTLSQQTRQLSWLAPLAAVTLAALVLLVAGRRRWSVLAGSSLAAAAAVAALAGLVWLPPALITSALDTSPARSLSPAIRSLAEAIARDQMQALLWTAAGLGLAAVLLGAVHLALKFHQRFKPKSRPTPASPDSGG